MIMHHGSVRRAQLHPLKYLHFTEFTEATRTTGGLSKHRQKPYNAYYPNN